MSLALYRKYRPSTFSEVVGQEQVTEPLMNALSNDRIHHAYLFVSAFIKGSVTCSWPTTSENVDGRYLR